MAHPEALPESNFTDDFETLATPPMDPLFFSAPGSVPDGDLGFPIGNIDDFDLIFDEFDDQFFSPDSENFLFNDSDSPLGDFGDFTPESGSFELSGNHGSVDAQRHLKFSSLDSGSCDLHDSTGVSSQGSGVSPSMNAASPNSGNSVVEQEIKAEETKKRRALKRKKENEDISISKCSRSSLPEENLDTSALSEDEKRRRARLVRNRESAQLSRQRKKHYVEELEDKVRSMHSTITDLNNKIAYFMAENTCLRQQLGSPMVPPPSMYPPVAPMSYPWMPYPPYMMKPQGSQVPLVPIPKLKPQQPAPAPKVKKSEKKKSEGKTKKVASVSFLGLLFFMLLFGGLVPMVNVKYGGFRDGFSKGSGLVSDGFYGSHKGRILQVSGHDESRALGSPKGKLDISHNLPCQIKHDGRNGHSVPSSEGYGKPENGSEPLVAALYVPRNDKLVKIDGNLIIHSVLASERATASPVAPEIKNKNTGLAVASDFSSALAIHDARLDRHSHLYRNPTERKALSSGSAEALKDHVRSSAADGKVQQWFHEGLAGPLLSSGVCTEVFQFDVSPKPGAIVPSASVANSSTAQNQNNTRLSKGRNRRTLHSLPVPVRGSKLNITEHSHKQNFQGNKTASSMVVSVLVDPREAGDGDADTVMKPKSLSKIFVVVLMDGVKYVTYSCVLPRSSPHLV